MQYHNNHQRVINDRERWKNAWPTSITALIAVTQMFLTFAVIGLETWSMLLSPRLSFLFVGYVASFFYQITWISTFCVVCCCRTSRYCATHAFVQNILSIVASAVLLYYDSKFLRGPLDCFWSYDLCYIHILDFHWAIWTNFSIYDVQRAKLIAIKAQIACAAVMLVLSTSFVLIYMYATSEAKKKQHIVSPQQDMELRPQHYPSQHPNALSPYPNAPSQYSNALSPYSNAPSQYPKGLSPYSNAPSQYPYAPAQGPQNPPANAVFVIQYE